VKKLFPVKARLRHPSGCRECQFVGVDRKWSVPGETTRMMGRCHNSSDVSTIASERRVRRGYVADRLWIGIEPQLPSAFFLWRRKTEELTPLKVGADRKSALLR
jgi:hypothetical protein